MSANDALSGLVTALRTIRGLHVFEGERDPQMSDVAMVSYEAARTQIQAQRLRTKYWTYVIRIVADLQDNRIAERLIGQYAEDVIDALELDRTLGGTAEIVGDIDPSMAGPDGFYQPPGIEKVYRSVVVRVTVTLKHPS